MADKSFSLLLYPQQTIVGLFLLFTSLPLFQYQAHVMRAVFGNQSELTPVGIAAQDSLLALIALPGYFVAVAFVGKLGPRVVQVRFRFRRRRFIFDAH